MPRREIRILALDSLHSPPTAVDLLSFHRLIVHGAQDATLQRQASMAMVYPKTMVGTHFGRLMPS